MKYIIAAIALILAGSYGVYTVTSPSESLTGGVGGDGTIYQLDQWKNDGTNITQNTSGTPVKLTGYESSGDCLITDSSGVVSTSTCASGSSKWTDAGTVIYPADGESIAVSSIAATGTATSTFAGDVYITGTTRLATGLTGLLKSTSGFITAAISGTDYEVPVTAGDGLTRTVNDFDCDTASGSTFGCLSAANWTTFNSKQDTITAGDALTLTGTDIDFDGGATPSGDLGGTWASPSVTDDSHAHTGATLSGIDISSDTNLAGDTEIVLTGDALSIAASIARDSELHSAITLSGALDYITLVGQDIVRGAIDLATDVSGFLGISNGGTGTSTAPLQDRILVGNGTGYDYRRIVPGSNVTISTSTPGLITIGSTAGGGSGATSTTIVCATGCEYTSIQSAINAGRTNIELKAETYNEFVSITASDTRIKGAGMYSSLITCAGSSTTACVKIATSSSLTRVTLEDFGIDNTSGVQTGVGLDTSDTSNVYTNRIRITDFDVAHLHQDTNNTSFYSAFYNMVYFDVNTCFLTGGTKSNDNALYSPRCRPEVYGYRFIDSEGWLLSSPNSEPASVVGTGLYIDGTSISITVLNPWFEGNATGTEIVSGALNTSIKGGRITAGTVGVHDAGTRTFLDSTLVSANTTDFTAGSTGLTSINGRSTFSAPSMMIGTTTPGSTYERLILGLSTSESTANALVINNYGAFATAPAAILFNNTTGGFAGTARIFANPGSGYTNANLNFAVADSAKALQTRITIDVDGDVGIGTTTPVGRLTAVGASSGTILQLLSNAGTKFMEMLNTGVTTLLGEWDFGGATSIEMVNGTGPTVNATGEFALDTTDNQFLVATGTSARALPTINKIWGATIASTSVDFASGGRIPLPPHRDGVVITEVHCFVDGGTSKVINIDTLAGGAQLDSLTCGTTLTSDTAQSANNNLSAGALMALEFGATTGSVDYVTFSAWGYVLPE